MYDGGTSVCRRSVAPLLFGYPGGTGDAEATVLQRNNSPAFFCSPMAMYSDVNREAEETYSGVRGRHIFVFFS
jgi:hypothetical protein